MQKRYRISLLRTNGEWDRINDHISQDCNTDWSKFWNKRIAVLKENYRKCPSCVTCADGDKVTKILNFTEEQYKLLEAIAFQMKKPVASVIDELIISPILHSPQ